MELLTDIFKRKDKTFSFEVFPTKTPEGEVKLLETIKELSLLKPDFYSCTYGAGGGNRDKMLSIVEHIEQTYKIPAMAHLTCISHTKNEIKEIINNIFDKNIKNILAMRGDPPKDNPDLAPGIDNFKYSGELVSFLRQTYKENVCIGVAGFPECHPLSPTKESDIHYLKQKLDCGADFIITQLFFDNRDYFNYVKDVRNAGIKHRIIPGVLPITSYEGLIKFCANCGATVTKEVHDLFSPVSDNPDKIIEIGIKFAVKQCKELLASGAPGIHFYTLNKLHPVKDILKAVRKFAD